VTTRQEIYEEVAFLTRELQETKIAVNIFSAAKEGNYYKVKELFEAFKEEKSDLYKRCMDFAEDIKALDEIELGIFDEDRKYGFFRFNKKQVDALSLYFLILSAEINEYHLFEKWSSKTAAKFVKTIAQNGFKELAQFIYEYSWMDWVPDRYTDWCELLIGIFKKEYQD